MHAEPVDYEDFDGDEDTVDLRGFHVVGGIFHFNLLQMPPQPHVVKNWTITQCQLDDEYYFNLFSSIFLTTCRIAVKSRHLSLSIYSTCIQKWRDNVLLMR